MSWYERHILPKIIELGCGCSQLTERRQAVVPRANGRVLELGVGAGANFHLYDLSRVGELVGIEPSPELRAVAGRVAGAAGLRMEIIDARAESLPFDDASFDTVVTTFTLCTVADPSLSLAEARRVLRAGGQLLFCEHGASPDPDVVRWQRRIDPVWKRVFGGCHLSRPVEATIARHFAIDSIERGYMPKSPRLAGWFESGRALAG